MTGAVVVIAAVFLVVPTIIGFSNELRRRDGVVNTPHGRGSSRLPALESRVAPREEAGVANFDDNVVVLGLGFCGSVAALRAVEKG